MMRQETPPRIMTGKGTRSATFSPSTTRSDRRTPTRQPHPKVGFAGDVEGELHRDAEGDRTASKAAPMLPVREKRSCELDLVEDVDFRIPRVAEQAGVSGEHLLLLEAGHHVWNVAPKLNRFSRTKPAARKSCVFSSLSTKL